MGNSPTKNLKVEQLIPLKISPLETSDQRERSKALKRRYGSTSRELKYEDYEKSLSKMKKRGSIIASPIKKYLPQQLIHLEHPKIKNVKYLINDIKDCIQKSTNIYNQEIFNSFIDKYNNILTFQGDKNRIITEMFNMLPLDKYYGEIEGQKFIFRNQENQAGIIRVGGYIAEGTYSTIHRGTYQYSKDSELENIVLRISKYEPPNQDDEQLFLKYIAEYRQELISGLEESLLGIVLYCYIQNYPHIFTLGNPFAQTKGIYKVAKTNRRSGRPVGSKYKSQEEYIEPIIYMGIENIPIKFDNLITEESDPNIFGVFAWLSFNFFRLQDFIRFIHRDFHTGNVMIKRVESNTINVGYPINNQKYKPYIIDLGETCANLRCDGCEDIQFPKINTAPHDICNNNSHDLRMLLAASYIYYFRTSFEEENRTNIRPDNRRFREYLQIKFQRYLDAGFTHPLTYYDELIHLVDPAFLPQTILNEISLFFDQDGNYRDFDIESNLDKFMPGNPKHLMSNKYDENGHIFKDSE